ncbi:MAG: DivIVA domain-containing protein [Christensenellales bacterium]|jgi:cell division initiation protein
MAITVTMIEEKEFKTKVRGYDPIEVDEFLDDICDEMIDMQNVINALREQLNQQQSAAPSFAPLPVQPITPPQPVPPPVVREEPEIPTDIEAAQQLLAKTQRICDETIQEAKKRADAIVKDAESSVPDPLLTDLEAERNRLREEIEALKDEAAAFRKRFQSMLQDQQEILETETELF